MAIALQDVANLTVLQLTRGLNQAAVLTVDHAIKVDAAEALTENTEVTYTDPDLGFVFRGRIVGIQELWQGGEGIRYTCADAFRTLAKEPALLNGSSKIQIAAATTSTAFLTTLLDEFQASGHSPLASYDLTALESVDVEPMDMAGQTMFEWLSRILDLTSDTVTWIEYDGSDLPVLMFGKYSSQPDLDLAVGNYEIVDPETDDNPLVVNARIGKSLDTKYSRLHLEGCGHFKRWEERYIPPASWEKVHPDVPMYIYRFNVPEEYATGRYLDEDGKCRDDMWVRIGMGYTAGTVVIGQLSYDLHGIETKTDEVTGQQYWEITLFAGGIVSVDPPPVPQIQCWFTYTGYMDGLVEERVGGLTDEGAFVSQHPDLFWYEGDPGVDLRPVLEGIADNLEDRYLNGADRKGNINVHIKGLDPDAVLGALVTAPSAFSQPRVRGIRYDFTRRNMTLDCADAPLRPEIAEAQMKARLLSEIAGNWYTDETKKEPSCFCGGAIFVDENGNFSPSPPGADEPGPSWDCIQGNCVEVAGPNGQYATEADCDRDCIIRGWEFVPCTGCVPNEFFGEYETEEECVADNPDPMDPSFSCGEGSESMSAPDSGSDEASGQLWDCSGCGCGGVGEYFLGFIQKLEVDKGGRVIKAECSDCSLVVQSGWTGSMDLVCSGYISEHISTGDHYFLPIMTLLTFSNGLLMLASTDGYNCWVDSATTTHGALLTDSSC